MTRVGLVTFHSPMNHGARLQTFALQTAIERSGNVCRVIHFEPASEGIHTTRSLSLSGGLRRIYGAATSFRFARRLREGEEGFERFTRNYLSLTSPVDSAASLESVANEFDAFICGSDQVWRDPNRGYYYLDFVPRGKKKIAYAPSFGEIHYSAEERKIIRNRVESFDSISAREKDGADFLAELTGRHIPTVLDPTLLMGKDFWRSIALPPSRSLPRRFILVFTVQNTLPCFRIAQEVHRRLRLPLIAVDLAKRLVWRPFLNNFFEAGPEEFLWLTDHAEFIVTTSFHGTAFAVNFEKPFLTVCQGSVRNVNSRIVSLADTLGFRERLLLPGQPIPNHVFGTTLDETAQKKGREQSKSLEFLNLALRNESNRP